jgi:uncharacterized protein (DUF1778 family)
MFECKGANVETITLSERDWDLVMDALTNPSEPNDALLRAAARFKEGRDFGDAYEVTIRGR